MKCAVCGAESGKYTLCRVCNAKKEKGEIIKCAKCGKWHYAAGPCVANQTVANKNAGTPAHDNQPYLYEVKRRLVSKSEQSFFEAILQAVPEKYCVFPQINLASFIERTDDARFHNELFRNVDFLITNSEYRPMLIVEINDQTHLTPERKERDEKVRKICEEAGIPILKLWTSYGVNVEYIRNKISETLSQLPVTRIHHYSQQPVAKQPPVQPPVQQPAAPARTANTTAKSGACYIATCVYGSYDMPQVWVLRRYRDNVLATTWLGRTFTKVYYSVSPKIVRVFGQQRWFRNIFKKTLDAFVAKLMDKGFDDTPYAD